MMTSWQAIRDRAGGKWQVPLFALSVVMLAASLLRFQPNSTRVPIEDAIQRLRHQVSAGAYESAIALSEALFDRKDLAGAARGEVHLWAARARSREASRRRVTRADVGNRIVEHYEHATALSQSLTAEDQERMGRALEWAGKLRQAITHYEGALKAGSSPAEDLRRHIISLRLDKLGDPPEEIQTALDAFLGSIGADRLDLALWAIERKLDLFERSGRLDQATTLLQQQGDRFEASDLRARFHYLEAWVLYQTDHFDEAETRLRTVRNEVERDDPVYAMTGWLLGRVVMEDEGPQRPEEALSFFEDVLNYHPDTPYAVASRIGSGDALAMLGRHAEALETYRLAIDEMDSLGVKHPVDRSTLRASLAVLAENERLAGHLSESVAYAQLATTLLEPDDVQGATLLLQQLGVAQAQLAADLDEPSIEAEPREGELPRAQNPAARVAFAAARTYQKVAQVNALNERRAAEASWRAAELFTQAGEDGAAIQLYRDFVSQRPQHPLTPRALLRLGMLYQSAGRLPEAVEAYKTCFRRFPRTLDAARSLVPLARSYVLMGPKYEDLAEKALRIVLEASEMFTPQAPEFADATLLMGEVLNRRGDFERAIPTLEEMLARYPEDARKLRTLFLLADSYRRSGLALKAEMADAQFDEEIRQMRADASTRFQKAGQLYRDLIHEYTLHDPAKVTTVQKVYRRLAYLYEADCFFEQQDYRQALKLYEQAVALYRDTASALAAYVQIINSHVFLGEPAEARAALARAMVLADSLPDAAFETSVSPEGRADWKRYFEWLGKSELF